MNLPNKLPVLRACLVPVFMVILLVEAIPVKISCLAGAVVFALTALTDMLDGKIARKHNLITDFGKFMDPLADKVMVICSLLAIMVRLNYLADVLVWVTALVVFRELAVTSMRLVVSTGEGIVIAANMLGKIKTVSQIVAISTVFLEPVVQRVTMLIAEAITGKDLCWRTDIVPLTWLSLLFAAVMTVWSGVNYIKAYWKYLDPQK